MQNWGIAKGECMGKEFSETRLGRTDGSGPKTAKGTQTRSDTPITLKENEKNQHAHNPEGEQVRFCPGAHESANCWAGSAPHWLFNQTTSAQVAE